MKKIISLLIMLTIVFTVFGVVYADTETYTLTKLEITDKGNIPITPLRFTINNYTSDTVTEVEDIIDVWFDGSQEITLIDDKIYLTAWHKIGTVYFYQYQESVEASTLNEGPNTIYFSCEKRGKVVLAGYYNIEKTTTPEMMGNNLTLLSGKEPTDKDKGTAFILIGFCMVCSGLYGVIRWKLNKSTN